MLKRERNEEKCVPLDYFETVCKYHDDWLLSDEYKDRVLIIDVNEDFENNDPRGGKHLIQLIFSAGIKETVPAISKKEKKIVLEFKYFSIEELSKLEIRPDIKSYLQTRNKNKKSIHIKSEWIQE